VFCCVLTVEFIVVYFFFPETRGLSLEEISVMFEGADAAVGHAALRKNDTEDPASFGQKHVTDETMDVKS
jgi:hypothetical protein